MLDRQAERSYLAGLLQPPPVHLSFLTTLSLVLFATPMTERFERLMNRLLPARAARPVTGFLNDALFVTLAARILTLPLIAHDFGRMSIVSPLTNLLVGVAGWHRTDLEGTVSFVSDGNRLTVLSRGI